MKFNLNEKKKMISYIYNYFFRLITKDLLNFSGCEGRLTFFLFYVNNFLLSSFILMIFESISKKLPSLIAFLIAILMIIYLILVLIATISLIIRRLRDMNTNVFLLFLIFVPGINIILFLFLLFYPGD